MATEQRLIDADELKRRIIAFATGCNTTYLTVDNIIMLLNQSDTVDAVPVVRCRECKHFGGHGICFCHAADVDGTPIFVREDDFCSYGERKCNV